MFHDGTIKTMSNRAKVVLSVLDYSRTIFQKSELRWDIMPANIVNKFDNDAMRTIWDSKQRKSIFHCKYFQGHNVNLHATCIWGFFQLGGDIMPTNTVTKFDNNWIKSFWNRERDFFFLWHQSTNSQPVFPFYVASLKQLYN